MSSITWSVYTVAAVTACGQVTADVDAAPHDATVETADVMDEPAPLDLCLAGSSLKWHADQKCGYGSSPGVQCAWHFLCGQSGEDDAGVPLSGACLDHFKMASCTIDGGPANGCPPCAPGERCVAFNEWAPPILGVGPCCEAFACVTTACYPDASWPLNCQ
jgi:hypothetical protein